MNFNIGNIIGRGKFGTVFQGTYKKEIVAIKIETSETGFIKHEARILNYLYHNRCHNIPLIYWYGRFEEKPCLIMTFFEISLFDYVKRDLHFCPPEKIIKNLLSNIKQIHSAFILHRDIKPQNIMFKHQEIFLVDFGLSATFVDDEKKHVIEKKDVHILGTPKYASLNIHDGFSASRRDDVISLIYVFLFIINKSLPWENAVGESDEYQESHILHPKNQERRIKKDVNLILHEFNAFSSFFLDFVRKTYSLQYCETPFYDFMIES